MKIIALLGATALIASTASATFTGWSVSVSQGVLVAGSLSGEHRDVYSVPTLTTAPMSCSMCLTSAEL